MTSQWKAVLGIILIFIFGFLAGVVCTSIVVQRKALAFFQHPAVALSQAMEKRMTGNLNLDPNQKQQVQEYFAENLKQRRQLQKQIQPEVQTLNQETFQQINSVLRPDQQERFRQNVDEFRRRYLKNAENPNAVPPPAAPSAGPATNSGTGTPPAH